MNRSLHLPGLLLVFAAISAAGAQGCGKQGEGERCSRDNGSEDCTGDLICVSAAELGLAGNSDVCCPDGAVSDDPRCQPESNGGEGGGATTTTTTTTTTTPGSGGSGGTGGSGGAGGTGGAGGATTGSGGTGGSM